MKKEIKEKLEELVTLLNDPEAVVVEKEVKEKLEVVMELLEHPEEITMDKIRLKEKLDDVVRLVNNARVDPEIEVEYYIPSLETVPEVYEPLGDPYVLVTYIVSKYNERKRKIRLRDTAVRRTSSEDLAKQITFSIEEFKAEIDSVEMG